MTTIAPDTKPDRDERREALLMEYACGALDDAMTLMVESWIALSAEAQTIVARYERLGGAMMGRACPPECTMEEDSLRRVLDRLDCPERAAATAARCCKPLPCNRHLPEPLQAYLDAPLRWGRLCRHIDMSELTHPAMTTVGHRVLLCKAGPGAAIAPVCPRNFEMTLVLDGTLETGPYTYRRGDALFAEDCPDGDYRADADQGCLSIVIGVNVPRNRLSGLTTLIRTMLRR